MATKSLSQDLHVDERLNCDYEACNCLFAEIGANGVGLSINYEKLFSRHFGVRGGFGFIPLIGTTIPFSVSWYNGMERKFELGLGATFFPVWTGGGIVGKAGAVLLSGTIGGKFQPRHGGLMIRFALTPFYSPTTNKVGLWGGISLGHAF